tara:strand:- start:128 stop:286 length:159 start_codon:yes stop_codon:yes gene_type:complete
MQGFQLFPFVFIGLTNYKASKWTKNKAEIKKELATTLVIFAQALNSDKNKPI